MAVSKAWQEADQVRAAELARLRVEAEQVRVAELVRLRAEADERLSAERDHVRAEAEEQLETLRAARAAWESKVAGRVAELMVLCTDLFTAAASRPRAEMQRVRDELAGIWAGVEGCLQAELDRAPVEAARRLELDEQETPFHEPGAAGEVELWTRTADVERVGVRPSEAESGLVTLETKGLGDSKTDLDRLFPRREPSGVSEQRAWDDLSCDDPSM